MKAVFWPAAIVMLATCVPATRTEDPSGDAIRSFPESMIECELLRLPPGPHERTTIRLYVKPQREDVSVTARFYLWKSGENLGRFPLQRLDKEKDRVLSPKDDGRVLFMAECVAEDSVKESVIHLRLIDERTGKILPGVMLPLKDAVIWKGP